MKKYELKKEYSTLIVLGGEVNRDNYSDFEDMINTLLQNGAINIIVSFKNLKYIVSDAITLLILAHKVLKSRNGKLIITDLNKYGTWVIDTFADNINFEVESKINIAMDIIS